MSKELRYEDYKDRLDIQAFEEAIEFEPIETRKGNDIGHCPDPWNLHQHGDSTGKFAIHRDKLVYNCWVCGGGSILSLAMAMRDLDVQEATDWLYQFTMPPAEDGEDFLAAIDDILGSDRAEEKKSLPYFNERVLDRWSLGDHPWYAERGINQYVQREYGLRYTDSGVKYAPKKNGKPLDEPYVGPTIVIPHYWGGRLVGWQHRWLDDERPYWCKKYTNTPDFPRNETVFNYDKAKVLATDPIVVVESVPTVLKLLSLGIQAVATFGSSLDERQLRLLRGFQRGVTLAPDNDKAGIRWLFQLADYLERYIPVQAIEPLGDEGNDLGDLSSQEVWAAVTGTFPLT